MIEDCGPIIATLSFSMNCKAVISYRIQNMRIILSNQNRQTLINQISMLLDVPKIAIIFNILAEWMATIPLNFGHSLGYFVLTLPTPNLFQ